MKLSFTPLFTGAVLASAALAPIALAQEASPAATAEAAATAGSTATPDVPAKPAVPAKPVVPVLPKKPAAVASPAPSPSTKTAKEAGDEKETLALAKAAADELAASVEYQTAQAKRVEARGKIADRSKGEIGRARERATDLVKLQLTRVEKAALVVETAPEGLQVLLEEIVALSVIAQESASSIAEVRTHDDGTEDTLQEIASCFEEIGEKASSFVDELSEQAERQGANVDIRVNEDGSVHFRAGRGDDRVFYGSPVEIKEGETVNDAVSIGESVTVHGHVLGSAVALGGNVLVGKTGRIDGDASAVGGRITVEDGGRIEGEQVSLGPGAATALLTQFASPPAAPRPLGARIGMKLVMAAAEFLCFFLLGLLTITVIPRRIDLVAEGLTGHPVKSGALGMLASFLFFPLTILLFIIVIGIPFVPILWFGYFLCGFVGSVALALVIGRRIPSKTPLTSTGTLAAGAGLLVAVGLVPILGWLVWIFAGIFALGAALYTRFGQDRDQGSNNTAVPGTGISSIA